MNKISELRDRIAKIEAEFSLVLGRLNGIHALMSIIARGLPESSARHCAAHLRAAVEKISADMLATPLPDSTIAETLKVLETGLRILESASRDH